MTEFTEIHGDDLLVTLTADIVSAHVANNSVAVGDLSDVSESGFQLALAGMVGRVSLIREGENR